MSRNNSPRLIHSLTNKFLFQELKSSSDLILKRQSSRNRKLPESLIPQEFLPRLTLRKGTIHRQCAFRTLALSFWQLPSSLKLHQDIICDSLYLATHSGAKLLIFSITLLTWKHRFWTCLSHEGSTSWAENNNKKNTRGTEYSSQRSYTTGSSRKRYLKNDFNGYG